MTLPGCGRVTLQIIAASGLLLCATESVFGLGIIFDSQFGTSPVFDGTVQQAVRDAPPDSVSPLKDAAKSIYSSDYADAILSLKKHLRQQSRDRTGWYLLALAYYGNQQTEMAIQAASQCCRVSKDWPQAHWLRGTLLADRGNLSAARDAFDTGIRVAPESPGGYLQRAKFLAAYAQQDTGDLALAISDLETTLRLGGPKIAAHGYLGIVYHKLNKNDAAEKQFLKVLEVNPHQIDAIERLTRLYDDSGQHVKSDRLLNRVRTNLDRLDPSRWRRVEGLHALSLARHALREGADQEQIEQHYRAAIKHIPQAVHWWLEFARWLDSNGRAVDAIAILDAGLEVNADNPDLAAGLAWLLADTGTDLRRASMLVEVAWQKEESRPFVRDTKAWIQFHSGNYQAAWREITPSLEFAKEVPDIAYHAGAIQEKLGNRAEALRFLELSLSSQNSFPGSKSARELHGRLKGKKLPQEKTSSPPTH